MEYDHWNVDSIVTVEAAEAWSCSITSKKWLICRALETGLEPVAGGTLQGGAKPSQHAHLPSASLVLKGGGGGLMRERDRWKNLRWLVKVIRFVSVHLISSLTDFQTVGEVNNAPGGITTDGVGGTKESRPQRALEAHKGWKWWWGGGGIGRCVGVSARSSLLTSFLSAPPGLFRVKNKKTNGNKKKLSNKVTGITMMSHPAVSLALLPSLLAAQWFGTISCSPPPPPPFYFIDIIFLKRPRSSSSLQPISNDPWQGGVALFLNSPELAQVHLKEGNHLKTDSTGWACTRACGGVGGGCLTLLIFHGIFTNMQEQNNKGKKT